MDMPQIQQCDSGKCSYNQEGACHAMAITVGGSDGPLCDTFWGADTAGGDPDRDGQVGACHMSQCAFNERLECQAGSGISVGTKRNKAACMTFQQS